MELPCAAEPSYGQELDGTGSFWGSLESGLSCLQLLWGCLIHGHSWSAVSFNHVSVWLLSNSSGLRLFLARPLLWWLLVQEGTFSSPLYPLFTSSLGTRSWPTVPKCTTTSTRSNRCSPWKSESPSLHRHVHPTLACVSLSCLAVILIFVCSPQTPGWAKGSWLCSLNRWGEWGRRFHSVWVSWTCTSE